RRRLMVDHQLDLHPIDAGGDTEVEAEAGRALEVDVVSVKARGIGEDRSAPAIADERLDVERVVARAVVPAVAPVLREKRWCEKNGGEKQKDDSFHQEAP